MRCIRLRLSAVESSSMGTSSSNESSGSVEVKRSSDSRRSESSNSLRRLSPANINVSCLDGWMYPAGGCQLPLSNGLDVERRAFWKKEPTLGRAVQEACTPE